jgi:dipeptidyl aminopeptidase/acylaminoacyl peptidase
MERGEFVELGGKPHEIPEVYRERSPLSYASSCKTPVLFVVGEADLRCHNVEAEQYHRVLATNGVPTEIVRLPNASHVGSANGPVSGRLAQNEALVRWFTNYVLPG